MKRRLLGKIAGYITYSTVTINKTYGDIDFINPITITGDGTITYSSNNTTVATINQNTGQVTILKPGEAIITATVTDSDYYSYETKNITYTLSVAKAAGNVSEPPASATVPYTGSPQQLVTSGSGTGTMMYKLNNGTWSNEIPTAINCDTYTIYYKSSENDYYTESAVGSLLATITLSAPDYIAPTAKALVYNGNELELLNAGSTSDGTFYYSTDNSTWSESIPKGTNADSYITYWKLEGDNNHTSIPSTRVDVTIDKAENPLTATKHDDWTYGGESYALISEATGEGTITYSLNDGEYSSTIPTATNAGTYIVKVKASGNSNYYSKEISYTITVNKVTPAVIAPTNIENLVYNESALALINAGSTDYGTLQYSLSEEGTYSTSIPTGTNAGDYTVWYRVIGNDNVENIDPISLSINTIAQATPIYTAPEANNTTYTGNDIILLTDGISLHGSFRYSSDGTTWSTEKPTGINAGNYEVYWKLNGDLNYKDIESTKVSVTIYQKSINPTVSMSGWTYEGTPTNPSVSGNDGEGTVTYYYKVNSADDSTYTTTKPGSTSTATTYKVKAVIAETSNYLGAIVYTTFDISKATGRATISERNLTYNGSNQDFLTVSENTGTMYYRIGESGSWSTSIPTIKDKISSSNSDSWTIYYYMDASTNYTGQGSSSSPWGSKTTTMEKVTPTIIAPTSKGSQSYTGSALDLVNTGSTDWGTLLYSLDHSSWSTSIPAAINIGTYLVYYRVVGDNNIYSMSKESPYYYTVSSVSKITEKVITATVIPEYNSVEYDKSAKTPSVTVKDGSTVIPSSEYTVSYSNNTNAGTATITITDNTGGNYDVTGSTTFTITQKTVTLSWGTLSWTYDGSAHSTTCTAGNLCSGDTCSVILNGNSITNKGTTTVYASGLSNFNYKLPSSGTSQTLTISARPINVTAGSNSKTYDGSALTHNSASAEGTGTNRGLVSGHSMTSCTVTGSITNVGSVNNVPSSAVIKSGSTDVTSNYNINYVNGTLTINARSTTVTANSTSKTYDGGALTYNSASASNLVSGHTLYSYSCSGSITNVGSVNNVPSGAVIKNGSTDVTSNYSITYANGTLTINARPVTYRANDESWTYDGNTHSASNTATLTSGSLVSGHSASFSCSGSIGPNVGSTTKTLSSVTIYSGSTNVSGNYSITRNNGTLYINRACTASASASNKTYNGSGQTGVSGSYVSWSGTTSATNAGSYTAYATPDGNHAWSDNCGTEQRTISWIMYLYPGYVGGNTTNRTYNGSGQVIGNITSYSGTPYIGFGSSSSSGPSSWSQSTSISATNAGTYYIWAKCDTSTNYTAVGPTYIGYATISKADQLPPSVSGDTQTYPNTAYASATGGGGYGYIEWSNGSSRSAVGYLDTYARWSGDSNHNASPWSYSYARLTVNKANPSITATPTDRGGTYTGSALNLLQGGSANISGSFSYSTGTNAGTYDGSSSSYPIATWTFTPTDTTNYNSVSGTVIAHIYPTWPTYTSAPVNENNLTYNGSAQALCTAGVVGSLPGHFEYKTNGSGSWSSYSTSLPTATNANEISGYSYYWKFVPNDTTNYYEDVGLRTGITIAKRNVTLTWTSAPSSVNVGESITVSATKNYGTGSITYRSSSNYYTTVSGNTVTGIRAGSPYIYADYAGDDNHNEASIYYTLTVNDPYVDLGLPSGIKWAKCNIGASSEIEEGLLFSWGNTTGHVIPNYTFNESNYNSTTGSLLSSNIPTNTTYDAARAILGGSARIPSVDNCRELWNNVNSSDETISGVNCVRLTSKINGKSIVIPKRGYVRNQTHIAYAHAFMWTATYGDYYSRYYFAPSAGGSIDTEGPYHGMSIRPVTG